MAETVRLRLKPEEFADKQKLKKRLEEVSQAPVFDWIIVRKSIDARQKQIWVDAEFRIVEERDNELLEERPFTRFKSLKPDAKQVIIVGAGPAGLFAALRAIELGWKPILLERGKPVDERLHDVVKLQKDHILNPDSNFCFGEGGAGAFSDGKLFTRSKKRGNVKEILALLFQHGAKKEILYDSHPHIGSDRLPKIIKSIRQTIIKCGGEVHFSTVFKELVIENGRINGVITNDGRKFIGPVILATGHSAHDVYKYLNTVGIQLEQKGFAMGVRLEHPQELIDRLIYHSPEGRGEYLPPAEYSLSAQVEGRGIYSFCMCPGGVIVPAPSASGESVVNGMSASGRSGRWANSGMVVEIRPEDFPEYSKRGELGLLQLQEDIERKFYEDSGSINAPAQRMKDFLEGKVSKSLPKTSYVPGIHSADLSKLLPLQISSRLKEGFKIFNKKKPGFLTNEATMIGLESRTSSPVRIPRDSKLFHHPDYPGLYPAGEGAGFAGGIVSSAIDGRRVMEAVALNENQ